METSKTQQIVQFIDRMAGRAIQKYEDHKQEIAAKLAEKDASSRHLVSSYMESLMRDEAECKIMHRVRAYTTDALEADSDDEIRERFVTSMEGYLSSLVESHMRGDDWKSSSTSMLSNACGQIAAEQNYRLIEQLQGFMKELKAV